MQVATHRVRLKIKCPATCIKPNVSGWAVKQINLKIYKMKISKKTNYVFDTVGFAELLSTKRIIKLKIDLRTASDLCGVGIATLSRLERGSVPDMLTFTKLCTWIEIEPTFFFKAVIK